MADSERFLSSVFLDACRGLDITVQNNGGGMVRATTPDGLVLDVYAADLGSVVTVTIALTGTEVARSMILDHNQASSVEFIQTHMLEWTLNGGQYGVLSKPHLQGLAPGMLTNIDSFLDDRSSASLRTTNRGLKSTIKRRCATPIPTGRSIRPNNSGMNRFVWRQLDIV